MGRIFLFIFAFALLEVMLLAAVAGHIGWLVTIAVTVVTAMLGSYLFRLQGLETWLRLNERMQRGEMPGQEMVEGMMLLLGGALLITPGFITDVTGFILLLPASRGYLAQAMIRRGTLQSMMQNGQVSGAFVYTRSAGQGPAQGNPFETPRRDSNGHVTIDGESRRTDDE